MCLKSAPMEGFIRKLFLTFEAVAWGFNPALPSAIIKEREKQ